MLKNGNLVNDIAADQIVETTAAIDDPREALRALQTRLAQMAKPQ